jgi:glycine cleavage system aminomethyltransferase T
MAWGKVKEQEFIGREAHIRHREEEPAATMCALTVNDHTSKDGTKRYMLGGEPILTPEGDPIVDAKGRRSYVTSAGAGPSIGKHILMTYLPPERAVVGAQLKVEYMGEQYPVTVQTNDSSALFDPENARVRT